MGVPFSRVGSRLTVLRETIHAGGALQLAATEHVAHGSVAKGDPMGVFSRFGQRLRQPRHRQPPEREVPRDQVPTKAERDDSWHERTDTRVHHDHQSHAQERPGREVG